MSRKSILSYAWKTKSCRGTLCAPKHRWRILVRLIFAEGRVFFVLESQLVLKLGPLWNLHCPSSMSTGLSLLTRGTLARWLAGGPSWVWLNQRAVRATWHPSFDTVWGLVSHVTQSARQVATHAVSRITYCHSHPDSLPNSNLPHCQLLLYSPTHTTQRL